MPRQPTASPPASPYPVTGRKSIARPTGKWGVLWRAKWKIIGVAVLAALAALLFSLQAPDVFVANSTVRVSSQNGTNSQAAVLSSNQLAAQYARLVDSSPVLRASETRLGVRPGTLDGEVTGGVVQEQNLIQIQAQGGSGPAAMERADAAAQAFVERIQDANAAEAAAYARQVNRRQQPLDRNIASLQAELTRLTAAAARGQVSETTAASLATRQNALNALRSQRNLASIDVAQVAATLQPDVTFWAQAQSTKQTQPRTVLYTTVAFLVGALVASQLVLLLDRRDRNQALREGLSDGR